MAEAETRRFPKRVRLTLSRDYDRIWKSGKRRRIGSLEVRFEAGDHPQIGISVAKAAGTAVKRNRIKRWIREHFRTHPELFGDHIRLVIVIRRDLPRPALERDLERLWRQSAGSIA